MLRGVSARRALRKALILLAPAMLAACDAGPPSGQVLAEVGGTAITQRDVDIESATPGAGGAAAAPGAVLDRLVDRALLLQLARDARLDLTPEHLAARRRGEADSLIALYRQQVGATVPQPSAAEIQGFVARRPWMFARRAQLVIDSIELDDPAAAPSIAPLTTLDAAAAALSARRARFQRSAAVVDSGALPDAEGRLLIDAALDATLLVQSEGRARIVSVISRVPAPITGEVARRVAHAVLLRMRVDKLVAEQVADARARAVVRYRPDLAPGRR